MLDKVVGGLFGALLAAGVTAGIVNGVRESRETQRRRATPMEWDPRFPQDDFLKACSTAAHRLPRVYASDVTGLIVTIHVKSISGLTNWKAEIDFNDYGCLTGKHWIDSENKQSPIPQAFASAIQAEVVARLGEKSAV